MRGSGRLAAVMCLLAGCVGAPPAPPQETEGTGGTTAVTTTSVSATTNPSGSSGPNPSTTSSDSGTTDITADDTRGDDPTDPTDPFPEDWGLEGACSTWTQDCPKGEKCMPWSFDGSQSWNATRCSPVGNDAAQVGDACVVEGSPYSGIDSCDLGLMCWNVSPETNVGTCQPLCQGNPNSPICEDPDTSCAQLVPDVLAICFNHCNPILQDCPEGGGCYPTASGPFVCVEPAGEVDLGEPCEGGGQCSPGLVCISAEAIPECAGMTGCCSPICDLDEADPCPQGLVCEPVYAEGTAPPGYETVGVCIDI